MATTKKTVSKVEETTPKKEYIVIWDEPDNGGDPVKVLRSLAAAKKFIADELFNNEGSDIDSDNVDKKSIRLYEGQLIGKPRYEITF